MVAAETQLTRRDMEALIVQRAWKDEAFRAEFLADAKGTIEKYAGQKLPADLQVVALAEDDKTIHFVIPPKPRESDQLSEEDLEKIAGGIDIIVGITFVTAFALAGAFAGANAGTKVNHNW